MEMFYSIRVKDKIIIMINAVGSRLILLCIYASHQIYNISVYIRQHHFKWLPETYLQWYKIGPVHVPVEDMICLSHKRLDLHMPEMVQWLC